MRKAALYVAYEEQSVQEQALVYDMDHTDTCKYSAFQLIKYQDAALNDSFIECCFAILDYELLIAQSSSSIFGSSVSMVSFENWQVPTALWPPPLYFNIKLPTLTSEVRFKIL